MKKYLTAILLLVLLTGNVEATNLADNALQPLYSAKNVKWAVQVDGMYPESITDQILIDADRPEATLRIPVKKPDKIVESYLYIFTSGYDCLTCEKWDVKINDLSYLTVDSHTDSTGPDPRGDGNRQTLRFKVSPSLIFNGDNVIRIRGTQFDRKDEYFIKGAVLVTFYESKGDHIYWIYDGVEYLELILVGEDTFYEETLQDASYALGSKGTLYTVVGIQDDDGNGYEEDDALFFNGKLFEPNGSNYMFGTNRSSFLDALKFDVSSQLKGSNDKVRFTFAASTDYTDGFKHEVPIYANLFILDVDLSDSTPPTVSIKSPVNNTKIPGNQSVEISFTVDDTDASVTLKIDNNSMTPSQVSAGNYSYIWDLKGVSTGVHNITATATDSSGNIGSAMIRLNVTKPAPIVTIDSPANGTSYSNKSNITILVSVDDLNSNLSIQINGVVVSNATSYQWDPSDATLGLNRITATSTDNLGQKGSDTVIINLTSDSPPETTTTTTTLTDGTSTTVSTTTSTAPTTTAPPQTAPPITAPPIPVVDLAINSLTLSAGSNILKKGSDITAYVLASNSGDFGIEATIVVYIDDSLIESKTAFLSSYSSTDLIFTIKDRYLEPGRRTIKARAVVQGENVEEKDTSNNERSIEVLVEENKSLFTSLGPALKYLAIVSVLLVLGRLAINFIFQREEDYLR